MSKFIKKFILFFLLTPILLLSAPGTTAAAEVDWSRASSKKITLFYPGVASFEFLTSDDHRLGGKKITQGKRNCMRCHLDESGAIDLKADEIAAGKATMKRSMDRFEPKPIPGKKGFLKAEIKVAYDDADIYIRISWESRGTGWDKAASAQNNLSDRVSLQVNKGRDHFTRYGCFITCHNDIETMPKSPTEEAVTANKYYSKIPRDDVHLYANYTRGPGGGWQNIKSSEELKKELAADGLIDIWSAELREGTATGQDGWLFEDRRWEETSDILTDGSWIGKGPVGRYTVTFKRKLRTGDKKDVSLESGDVFTVAVSIHDDNTEKRQHYVSFPITVGLGKDADIKAKKTK